MYLNFYAMQHNQKPMRVKSGFVCNIHFVFLQQDSEKTLLMPIKICVCGRQSRTGIKPKCQSAKMKKKNTHSSFVTHTCDWLRQKAGRLHDDSALAMNSCTANSMSFGIAFCADQIITNPNIMRDRIIKYANMHRHMHMRTAHAFPFRSASQHARGRTSHHHLATSVPACCVCVCVLVSSMRWRVWCAFRRTTHET